LRAYQSGLRPATVPPPADEPQLGSLP